MNRLTFRTEDGWVGVNNLEDKTVSPTSVAIHKLAEFEDFMEEQGFEDLESFKWALNFMKDLNKVGAKTLIENQTFQDRWQKLKEWALYMCYFELADKMEELEYVKDINVPSN